MEVIPKMFEDFLEFINRAIIEPLDKHPIAGAGVFFCIFLVAMVLAVHKAQSEISQKQQSQVQCQCVHSKQVLPEMP